MKKLSPHLSYKEFLDNDIKPNIKKYSSELYNLKNQIKNFKKKHKNFFKYNLKNYYNQLKNQNILESDIKLIINNNNKIKEEFLLLNNSYLNNKKYLNTFLILQEIFKIQLNNKNVNFKSIRYTEKEISDFFKNSSFVQEKTEMILCTKLKFLFFKDNLKQNSEKERKIAILDNFQYQILKNLQQIYNEKQKKELKNYINDFNDCSKINFGF